MNDDERLPKRIGNSVVTESKTGADGRFPTPSNECDCLDDSESSLRQIHGPWRPFLFDD